jgi:hypothetical protein
VYQIAIVLQAHFFTVQQKEAEDNSNQNRKNLSATEFEHEDFE